MEYWNDGFMDRYFTLIEVGGASACTGLEAEGNNPLPRASARRPSSEALLNQKECFFLFDTQYSIIPTFHQSIGSLFQEVFQLGCSGQGKVHGFL
jgi:hypothetical protein